MDAREAEYLIRLSMERSELCLSIFGECRAGEITLLAAITKVLSLSADEVEKLSDFLQTSPFGYSALNSEAEFVACCNAFAATRQRKVNMTMARAAFKWNIRLQRARRNLHKIKSMDAPDLQSEFDQGITKTLASEKRFRRQQSVFVDTTQLMSRGSSLGEPSSPRTPLSPSGGMRTPKSFKRQQTVSFSARPSQRELEEMFEEEEEKEEEEEEDGEKEQKAADAVGKAAGPAAAQPVTHAVSMALSAPKPEERALGMVPPPKHKASGMIKSAEMGEESAPPPLPTTICGTFSCHGMDEGKDKANQDCACLSYPLKNDPEAGLFLVLDGHGDEGHTVSNELLVQVCDRMNEYVWSGDDATNTALCVTAFEEAHESTKTFRVDPTTGKGPAHESGAVAVAVILRRGRLTMAWAGDCRAIMGTRDEAAGGALTCVELTKDHKLEDQGTEQHRIEATGAFIRPTVEEPYYSPARVFADRTNPKQGPGLTMSRSLGDCDADPCGIIPTPEVAFRQITPGKDAFIVLASDGLWEFISNDDVINIVGTFLEQGKDAIDATRFLIAKAAMAWRVEEGDYRDDITCIVLYLHDLPPSLASSGAIASAAG